MEQSEFNPKNAFFLFDPFGVVGLTNVIVQVNKKNDCCTYGSLKKQKKWRLSETTGHLFHFINEFGKFHNVTDTVKLNLLEDHFQDTEITVEFFNFFFTLICLIQWNIAK